MKRGTKRTFGGAAARSAAMSMRGMPTIHSSASSIAAPGLEQHVEALVGAQQAEEQHDALVGAQTAAAPARARSARCAKAPCGITCTRSRVDAELADQPRAAVLGVHDDRVEAVVQPPLRRALAGPRLARQHVVGGQHERRAPAAAAREQVAVELLHGQPLEVHDVGRARGAPVAQHVGHVLGELQRAPRARAPARRRDARAAR